MGSIERRQRICRRLAQPGRQHRHQHRLPCERVAELEPLPIGDDQDPFDRPGQRPDAASRACPLAAGRISQSK